MSAHTPTGSRSVTSMPGGTIGIVSPKILFAAPPQYSKTFADDVDLGARDAIGLPAVARLERGEVLLPLADQERRLREDAAALAGARPRPRAFLERVDGDVDRAAGVLGAALGHLGHGRRRAGLDHLDRLALRCGDAFPADHQQLRHAPLLRDVTGPMIGRTRTRRTSEPNAFYLGDLQLRVAAAGGSPMVVAAHALPARSVARIEGVQTIEPLANDDLVIVPLAWVPSVMVIVEPLMTIVELLNLALAVT